MVQDSSLKIITPDDIKSNINKYVWGQMKKAPKEFILRHDALSMYLNRAESKEDNVLPFLHDLLDGVLLPYKGSYVAYQKGILCGNSRLGQELWETASSYYGGSSLSIFLVPEDFMLALRTVGSGLEKTLNNFKFKPRK